MVSLEELDQRISDLEAAMAISSGRAWLSEEGRQRPLVALQRVLERFRQADDQQEG